MPDTISIENADLERDAYCHESNLARLAGRLKFACCRRCGSEDGMQAVHREVVADFGDYRYTAGFLHKDPGNDEYLFYPCYMCNSDRIVPDGYEPMNLLDVPAWLDRDPVAPDYAALAAEEPVLASLDSRESAGLEG